MDEFLENGQRPTFHMDEWISPEEWVLSKDAVRRPGRLHPVIKAPSSGDFILMEQIVARELR